MPTETIEPTHANLSRKIGTRTVYALVSGNYARFMFSCNLMPDGYVTFTSRAAEAREYFAEPRLRHVQDIFPGLRKEHREILITATSPAEYDALKGRRTPTTLAGWKARYTQMGYVFDADTCP